MKAQEYRMELGLTSGMASYMGEANTDRPLLNPGFSGGVLGRYHLSGTTSIKGNVQYAHLSGSTSGNAGAFLNGQALQFDRKMVDATLALEWGFYPYGVPEYLPGSSRISPYLSVGLGTTCYRSDRLRLVPNIPMGLGVKMKVQPRLNLGCEWIFRMTLADDLDYSSASSGFQLNNQWAGSSGWNKNKDWYSVLMLYLTLDLYGTGSRCYR